MTEHRLPPGPPPVNRIWHMLPFMRAVRSDPLEVLDGMHTRYGDTAHFEVFGSKQYFTINPDFTHEVLVKQAANFQKDSGYTDPHKGLANFLGRGLLTSNGDLWKRQRKLVAPALHAKRIEAYAQTMVDYTQRTIIDWQSGAQLDVSRQMNALTMRIVAKSLFNTEVAQVIEMVNRALVDLQDWAIIMNFYPLPTWLPTPIQRRARHAKGNLDAFVYQTIRERRASGDDQGDLLSMLLLSQDEDGNGMSEEQARDEIMTLFLAGHETTANALNWTWMLLAQNPDAEAKLHAELDSVLQGQPATLADLKRLPYTEMIIKESMRLYPPAYSISRETLADTTVNGYDVPKGSIMNIYIRGLHRNPASWNDAAAFKPERFSAENEPNIPRYAYLPFGGGPRVCIGNHFAMMEAQLILVTIAQQFRLRMTPGQTVAMKPMITLNPKDGLPMTVEKRAVTFSDQREFSQPEVERV
jgi:cytochrome P450